MPRLNAQATPTTKADEKWADCDNEYRQPAPGLPAPCRCIDALRRRGPTPCAANFGDPVLPAVERATTPSSGPSFLVSCRRARKH